MFDVLFESIINGLYNSFRERQHSVCLPGCGRFALDQATLTLRDSASTLESLAAGGAGDLASCVILAHIVLRVHRPTVCHQWLLSLTRWIEAAG